MDKLPIDRTKYLGMRMARVSGPDIMFDIYHDFGTKYPTMYQLESKKTELESDLLETMQTIETLQKGKVADKLTADVYSQLVSVYYNDKKQIDADSRNGTISKLTRSRINELLKEAEGEKMMIERNITSIEEMIDSMGGYPDEEPDFDE